MKKQEDKKVKKIDHIKTGSVLLALLVLWVILSRAGVFSSYVFPGPGRVWSAFISMAVSGELITNILASLGRVFLGFVISFVLAFILGILTTVRPGGDAFYRPILEFLRHVPPMSLIPLLILWFGIGEASKIIVIVLTAFFPIFMNTESGLKGCDPGLLEVGEMLHMTPFRKFMEIRLPAAIPQILVGMQIGLGYSWRAIVGAEMIAAVSGLGYMILDAQAMSRSDKMLVGILLIGILGFLMDLGFKAIIRRVTPGEEAK